MISPRFRRPVFLDLTKIRMPIGALTSIGHRISGVVLTIGVPVVVYLMAVSLEGEESFAHVSSQLRHAPVKAALVILVWRFRTTSSRGCGTCCRTSTSARRCPRRVAVPGL